MRAAACTSASRCARGRRASALFSAAPGSSRAATLAALTPSYFCVCSSTAASPRERTSARISRTRRPTSSSRAESKDVIAFSRSAKSGWALENRAISGMLADRIRERVEQGLDRVAVELERRLVDDEPRADGADVLDRVEAVGSQGVARRDQIDDRIGEPEEGRELHRPVELDEVDVHALRREVLASGLHVLGRDAKPRTATHRAGVVESLGHGDNHPARRDAEVERLVEAVTAVLE